MNPPNSPAPQLLGEVPDREEFAASLARRSEGAESGHQDQHTGNNQVHRPFAAQRRQTRSNGHQQQRIALHDAHRTGVQPHHMLQI